MLLLYRRRTGATIIIADNNARFRQNLLALTVSRGP
jgi:hypothetical protein